MNSKIIYQNEIKLCGLSIELTRSQEKNFQIISQHWKHFNQTIFKAGLKQSTNWKKFGLTIRTNASYRYISAIPSLESDNLESYIIEAGNYIIYEHLGPLHLISKTMNKIYNDKSLENQIDKDRTLIQYEVYDQRFNWNSNTSIIEIRIPIKHSLREDLC